MDILKRNLAPLSEEAWEEIEDQAKMTIKGNLTTRSVVDFSGPHGWDFGAVGTGRIEIADKPAEGVPYGIREVVPLVEIRIPFTLDLREMDSISRGLKDPDLDAVEEVARKAALFEEKAVYYGFKDGNIEGIAEASPLKSQALTRNASEYPEIIEKGVLALEEKGRHSLAPFDLVLGNIPYQTVMIGDERGYPLKKRIQEIIQGELRWSPAVKGGILISRRGGDYLLTVGQDFSIGYTAHTSDEVELYLTESMTFQVFEPAAALEFKLKTA
ncbi:MAG: family 1 encapsulin nanocompartment shell protein [Candidatus Aminicenantes bacterium]